MFGQSYIKYEIFPKLNEPEVLEKLSQYSILKPIDNHNEDYILYGYQMKNTVRLDYLIECMPFIKITFAQLLLIIRQFILAAEKFIDQGLIPQEIKIQNIYLITKDQNCQFTYYFQNIDFNIDFIGIKWIQANTNTQIFLEKFIYNMKDLTLQLFNIFKQKYDTKKDDKLLKLQEKFQSDIIQNPNVLKYIEKFYKSQQYGKSNQYFSSESDSLREQYKKFRIQINKGSDLIEQQIMEIQKKLNTDLDNNYVQIILSSLKAHLYKILYNLLFQEIGAFFINDKISEYEKISNETLKEFRDLVDFDNTTPVLIFENLFSQYISLQMHFKSYYNFEKNWIDNLKQHDIKVINYFLIVAGQQLILNQYIDLKELLRFLKQFKSDYKPNQLLVNFPLDKKKIEYQIIILINLHLQKKIDTLF